MEKNPLRILSTNMTGVVSFSDFLQDQSSLAAAMDRTEVAFLSEFLQDESKVAIVMDRTSLGGGLKSLTDQELEQELSAQARAFDLTETFSRTLFECKFQVLAFHVRAGQPYGFWLERAETNHLARLFQVPTCASAIVVKQSRINTP